MILVQISWISVVFQQQNIDIIIADIKIFVIASVFINKCELYSTAHYFKIYFYSIIVENLAVKWRQKIDMAFFSACLKWAVIYQWKCGDVPHAQRAIDLYCYCPGSSNSFRGPFSMVWPTCFIPKTYTIHVIVFVSNHETWCFKY